MIALLAGAAVLQGCGSGMDAIDRRLAQVLGENNARAGLEAQPHITPPVTPSRERAMYQGEPTTTNPPASRLTFQELDRGTPGTPAVVEGLNARLSAYAREAVGIDAENAIDLSLTQALRLSQQQGNEYRNSEEDYIVSAIRLLIERHRWGPRLFADSSVNFNGDGDEGRFSNTMSVVNSLRATQQLPYGGQAEARWVWNATEQLRSSVSGQYRDSSSIVLDASVPLLRGAGMIAREDIIQAERDLVYAARDFESFRRTYFVGIAQDYFRLLQNVNELRNRVAQLQSLGRYVSEQEALYEAGRISQFKVNEARNDLVSAMSSLASSREQYTLALDRFKVRLGIPIEQPVRLVGAMITVSEPSTTLDAASQAALEYRLDLQNRRDQLIDTRRGVLNARNQLLPDLDLSGQVSIPTDPAVREGGLAIDPDEASWEAGLMLSLPLDRRIERLQLRQALIQLQQAERSLNQFIDQVVLDVRRRVREIDLARFRLELAEAQVLLNEKSIEEQRLKPAETTTRDRLQAEQNLLNARNNRDAALTDLRVSILNYLDVAGELRVSTDGAIEPIPGMTVQVDNEPINFDDLFTENPNMESPDTPDTPMDAPAQPPADPDQG